MKYLLILFSLISFAYAQEPAYTPMRLNYQFRGIKVDSLFLVPSFTDTTSANTSTIKNVAGAMIRCGNDFWMRNATTTSWLQNINVGEGSSPSVQFVDSIYRVVGKDSIFWRKAGNEFAIKDSTGGGVLENFANTDLSATGNRTHNFKDYDLTIDSVKEFYLKSGNSNKDGFISIYFGESSMYSQDLSDGTSSTLYITKDSSSIGSNNSSGQFNGLRANAQNNTLYLGREGNRAYLPTRNFSIDTLALLSDITGGTDSPDRINGTATGPVTADMDNNNIRFSNVDQFAVEVAEEIYLEGYQTILTGANITQRIDTNEFSIKDFNNTLLTLDTLGNSTLGASTKAKIEVSDSDSSIMFYTADPMTWRDKAFDIKSQVKTGFADNAIDLSLGSYVIKVPGVYVIPTSDATNDISLPDAAIWAGQSVQIINKDAGQDANLITQGAATIWNKGTSTTINKVAIEEIGVFYSDGQDWYAFKL